VYCDSENVVKYGTNPKGKQRVKCKESIMEAVYKREKI
jgi:transposase-like protein